MNEEAIVRALQALMEAVLRVEAKVDAMIVVGGIPVADMMDGVPDPATGRPVQYVADFETRLVLRRGGITHGKTAPMFGLSTLMDAGRDRDGNDHALRGRPERGSDESAEAE